MDRETAQRTIEVRRILVRILIEVVKPESVVRHKRDGIPAGWKRGVQSRWTFLPVGTYNYENELPPPSGRSTMTTAYLGIGSNEGRRRAHLQAAVDGLEAQEGVRVTAASPVYETEAHTKRPQETQPPFWNAVLCIETTRSPDALLHLCHTVEASEGRERDDRQWAPRPLDIDLLTVGSLVRNGADLVLPHPRLAERRFVLRPWADLEPDLLVPPPFGRSVRELLEDCPDTSAVVETSCVLELPRSAPASSPTP